LLRLPLPFWVLLCCVLALSSTLALSQSLGNHAFMPVSEIQPGMKGYGLTVFRGDRPERFDVEVIDVLRQFRPDQDMVLIRTSHPILERAITVAGMSGSPIYLNDRLIGAYAYGWQFGNEPIAGVTPIANMLAELTRPIDPQIWKALGTSPLPTSATAPPRAARQSPLAAADRDQAQEALAPVETRWGIPRRATTPLQIAGIGETATQLLARAFEPYGLLPVQAGASAAGRNIPTASDRKAHYVDGGSIGVQLVRGDISLMAVGTVTHVAGQRLVAFGHPMLNAGQVAFATCGARVVHVISSLARSFKLAEPSAPLGVLVHDRQSAVVVDQGLSADMLPMRVHLHGVPQAPRSEWSLELANHRMLTPNLVATALVAAIEASVAERTDSVVRVESRIAIERHGEQRLSDVLFTLGGPSDTAALGRLRMFSVLEAAYTNPFESAHVTHIDVHVHVQLARDLLTLVDAQLSGDSVDPGATVSLALRLRNFDAPEQVQLVPIHIPRDAAGETLELNIQPGDEVAIDQPKPDSLDDMLRALRERYAGTSLVVSTKRTSQGIKLRGQLVPKLPGSLLDTLQPSHEVERGVLFPTYERAEVPLGHAVTGSAKLKINVREEPQRETVR